MTLLYHNPDPVELVKFKAGVATVPLAKDNVEANDPVDPNVLAPDTFNVPVIPVLVNDDTPTTFNEFNEATEVEVKDPPIPMFPDVFNPAKDVNPETDNEEENTPADDTVRDCPIPTFPVRSENPFILIPPLPKIRSVTVKEDPIPVLPDVVKVES